MTAAILSSMFRSLAFGAALSAGLAAAAAADAFPDRPVRLIVPLGPGGGTDLLARVVAERAGKGARPKRGGGEPRRRRCYGRHCRARPGATRRLHSGDLPTDLRHRAQPLQAGPLRPRHRLRAGHLSGRPAAGVGGPEGRRHRRRTGPAAQGADGARRPQLRFSRRRILKPPRGRDAAASAAPRW